jgi:hypothetical protein
LRLHHGWWCIFQREVTLFEFLVDNFRLIDTGLYIFTRFTGHKILVYLIPEAVVVVEGISISPHETNRGTKRVFIWRPY